MPRSPHLPAQSSHTLSRGVLKIDTEKSPVLQKGGGTQVLAPVSFIGASAIFLRGCRQLPSWDQAGSRAQGCVSGPSASPCLAFKGWACTQVCTCTKHIHRATYAQVHPHTIPSVLKLPGLRRLKRRPLLLHPPGWTLSENNKCRPRREKNLNLCTLLVHMSNGTGHFDKWFGGSSKK